MLLIAAMLGKDCCGPNDLGGESLHSDIHPCFAPASSMVTV